MSQVELKCPAGHTHTREKPDEGEVVRCPDKRCNHDEVWSEDKNKGFTAL